MNIFKAYDVRGIYPQEINEKLAYLIGRATAQFLKAKKIAVGRDIRKSSPQLFKHLVRGINQEGVNVYDLGLITTPMLYFASGKLDVEGAIMITASHNPAQYNGMKFCRKKAIPIGAESGLQEIEKMVLENNFNNNSVQKGKIVSYDIKEEYFNYFSSFLKIHNQLFNLSIDPANAMGILELEFYQRFPQNFKVQTIYANLDGKFPHHEANPLKTETLHDLQKEVIKNKSDLGIAYDGDADRVGFVDEKGEIIPMDAITALVAKIILEKNPHAKILYDLRSSMAVKEIIEENGGQAIECRVGHAFIKKQMREEKAIFAGELSGHYYFQENYNAEATPLVISYLFNLMSKTKKTISQLVDAYHRYYHTGEINNKVKNKDKVLKTLEKKYSTGKISFLDGIKVSFWKQPQGQRWWFNVRPSNTEPILRLNLEADNKDLMERKKEEILKIVTQ